MAVLPEGAPFLPIRVSTQATFLPSGEMAVCSKVLAANSVSTAACNGEWFADGLGEDFAAARGFAAGACLGGAGLSLARPARARATIAAQTAGVPFAVCFTFLGRGLRDPLLS